MHKCVTLRWGCDNFAPLLFLWLSAYFYVAYLWKKKMGGAQSWPAHICLYDRSQALALSLMTYTHIYMYMYILREFIPSEDEKKNEPTLQ